MDNKILVIIEQRNNIIKKSSLEAVSFANQIADNFHCEIAGILVGGNFQEFSILGKFGLKKLVHIGNPELNNYSSSAFTKIISDYVNQNGFNYIITANTTLGKDLAPRIAAKLDAGIVVDVTEFRIDNDEIIFTRPIFAGKALAEIKINNDKKIISIRPNTFKAVEANAELAVEKLEAQAPDLSTKVIEIKLANGKIDVAEAEIIVSGGRGMKAPENFNLIENLAEVLGAATGASRAVVDAGWRPHSEQVGQTGKTVSPNLYIAAGISGAIQHLAGMRSSKCIVAINKDKDAPIFQVADYGIVGDVFEILPKLTEEIKKLKS